MLSSRLSSNLAKRFTAKPAVCGQLVKRNLTMKVVNQVSPIVDLHILASASSALKSVSTKAIVEKGQYEHLYRNELLERIFSFESVMGEVQEDEMIEECVKRTYQPNWKRRKAKHGFLARNATPSGRKLIRRRANAGRRISV